MKIWIAATLWIAGAFTPAFAEGPCLDTVTLVGWSAKAYGREYGRLVDETEIRLGLRNHGTADIVMIEATASFEDALGNSIEPFPAALPADILIAAGTPGNLMVLSTPGTSRLASIDNSLVTASVCVRAIVTAEGKVIRVDLQQ